MKHSSWSPAILTCALALLLPALPASAQGGPGWDSRQREDGRRNDGRRGDGQRGRGDGDQAPQRPRPDQGSPPLRSRPENGGEQGEVRRERQAGNVRPLRDIEREVLPRMGGMQYLGPEYDPAGMSYRLKFIQNGKVHFIDIDARTGRIIGQSR